MAINENVELEIPIGNRKLVFQSGKIARQSNVGAFVSYGDTTVLVTVVADEIPATSSAGIEDLDFFPLTVEYRERAYAAGKFPGGFIKREGRPADSEILSSRMIDRALRPFFSKAYQKEVQIMVTVLSSDQENDPGVLGINGASLALCISDIPFLKQVAAVKVGRTITGEWICNPTYSELEESDIDIVVAGNEDTIVMLEGSAKEVSESDLINAIEFGYACVKEIIRSSQSYLSSLHINDEKLKWFNIQPTESELELERQISEFAAEKINKLLRMPKKVDRDDYREQILQETIEKFSQVVPEENINVIKKYLSQLERRIMRQLVLDEKIRVDGRGYQEIRPISCEVGFLKRAHGSALFTRGETQALVVTTLGTVSDEQVIDNILGETTKRFMFHYNFPPFSTGEVRPLRGPGRREIGHGALAEKALQAVIPHEDAFPYTIRVVSDILESNGSSSMASVCGGSLSLMDAGVPILAPVAGVAMGLVEEGEKYAILTDIIGLEDRYGDMDFKIAGSEKGITAVQLDIKSERISIERLRQAIFLAREAHLFTLNKMKEVLSAPRSSISPYAPRIVTLYIKPDKIRDVIGPAGKTITKIINETGVKIDIDPSGRVVISSVNEKAANIAKQMIEDLTAEVEIGKIYVGKVTRTTSYGAFVEILPGKEGLVHISELDFRRIANVEDVVKVGDDILVKVIEIDELGRINLSRKQALKETAIRTQQQPTIPHNHRHQDRKRR